MNDEKIYQKIAEEFSNFFNYLCIFKMMKIQSRILIKF